MDLATVDHLLCSTRSVRKRLDFKRPVPAELITRCIEIALQAPTGSNAQGWHFLVVTDPALRGQVIDFCHTLVWADGQLTEDEEATFEKLRADQMSRVDVDHLRAEVRENLAREKAEHAAEMDKLRKDIVQKKGWMAALDRAGGYHIYNLGESRPVSLSDLIAAIERALGKKAIIDRQPLQPGDVHQTFADVTLASRDLGYEPRTHLDDGLKQFVEWYRAQPC